MNEKNVYTLYNVHILQEVLIKIIGWIAEYNSIYNEFFLSLDICLRDKHSILALMLSYLLSRVV